MDFNISLSGNSTKETILKIIVSEWPLSAKKIFLRLKKEKKSPITYQGVHKALQELYENNIIDKIKEGYKINNNWINQLENFSKSIKEELDSTNRITEKKEIARIVFKNHLEFIRFNLNFIGDLIRKEGKADVVFHFRHLPFFHLVSSEEISKIKKYGSKLRWEIVSKNKGPLEIWNASQWNRFGVKTKFDKNISSDRLMIMNDYIFHIYTSKESLIKWDKSYDIKSLKEVDTTKFSERITSKDTRTIVTIMEDRELAKLLR